MSHAGKSGPELPPIATLLTPEERPRVDAAGEGCYRTLHRENVDDLIRDLKAHRIQAILVSVSCASQQATRVASLVREFPRVPAVALLSEFELRTPHAVLTLGHCGIRRLVDVRLPAGWRELRGALMADAGHAGHRGILGQLALDLAGAPEDCWIFFETIFTCSPRVGNVRLLARHFDVMPSTLMSRFFRAGVPTPKRYCHEQEVFVRLNKKFVYDVAMLSESTANHTRWTRQAVDLSRLDARPAHGDLATC